MRKIIAIGECVLDTLFRNGVPERAFVGGRIANAAASLATLGLPVTMVSECGADCVGDIIIKFLNDHKVETSSIDRFTEGTSALSAIFTSDDGTEEIVNYGKYPENRFSVKWPPIEKDDIVIFGSLYAIDTPQRERLFELVTYAAERKAIIIYLPGFQHGINFRIARVMLSILENLETSNIVVAHQTDIDSIFPGEDGDGAYGNHIEFYCHNYFHVARDNSVTLYYKNGKHHVAGCDQPNRLAWQAGITAGVIYRLIADGISHDDLSALTAEQWEHILAEAVEWAEHCASQPDNCISSEFAAKKFATMSEQQE